MTIALIVLAVLIGVSFGVGGYLFFAACGHHNEINWLDEAEISRTPYARFYPHVKESYEWLAANNAQDVYTQSEDGLRLHATWVPTQNARATVLLVHGYHSGIYTDFGLVMKLYHDMGISILLPDQRGHGRSEGCYTTFGVKESRDMLQWIHWHNKTAGECPMFLSGLSMGASTVMYLSDVPLPENVRFFVVDCGFNSPYDIIGKVFSSQTHIPAWPFLWATDLFARFFAGFSLKEKDSVTILRKNTHPILMIHGMADDFVPCDMTRKAFAACTGDKHLLLVEGAGHGVSYLKAGNTYFNQILALLDKYIPEQR